MRKFHEELPKHGYKAQFREGERETDKKMMGSYHHRMDWVETKRSLETVRLKKRMQRAECRVTCVSHNDHSDNGRSDVKSHPDFNLYLLR
ncbi:hypothetical protein DPMN_164885 [Dreissena polymorpha]|uniref:Uncharacterized protein n=1 Tax=Dreissena polymorpha TaxID=45954 RepID=A0A9D4EYM0_DREPO|nr:hypothetical protein DPMN_164885 [Dreissena polymorpha]